MQSRIYELGFDATFTGVRKKSGFKRRFIAGFFYYINYSSRNKLVMMQMHKCILGSVMVLGLNKRRQAGAAAPGLSYNKNRTSGSFVLRYHNEKFFDSSEYLYFYLLSQILKNYHVET